MAKPAFLLGAGASKDAGLPDAFELTELIYKRLKEFHPREAHLFAFVVAKLNVRRVRMGASPFERINVEEAYYALKRYLGRDDDSLSEFVSQWDDLSLPKEDKYDPRVLAKGLSGLFGQNRRTLSGVPAIQPQSRNVVAATEQISKIAESINPLSTFDSNVFLNALDRELQPTHPNLKYLQRFVTNLARRSECVGTLNYDMTIENACSDTQTEFDCGLKDWNTRRTIAFRQDANLHLFKLHGSISWSFSDEDAIVENANSLLLLRKAMVFGGQQDKLVSDGPFLALRHKFQERLLGTNKLAIIGYSFGDRHINSLIRAWLQTRKNAKLVVVDPGQPPFMSELRRYTLRQDEKSKRLKSVVEIQHIRSGFGSSVREVEQALSQQPNPVGYDIDKLTNEPVNVLSDWVRDSKIKTGLLARYLSEDVKGNRPLGSA